MEEKKNKIEEELPPINLDDDKEIVVANCIKFMLKSKMPMEDIQYLTKKSIEEIKEIGGLSD